MYFEFQHSTNSYTYHRSNIAQNKMSLSKESSKARQLNTEMKAYTNPEIVCITIHPLSIPLETSTFTCPRNKYLPDYQSNNL